VRVVEHTHPEQKFVVEKVDGVEHDHTVYYGKGLSHQQKDALYDVVLATGGRCRPKQVQDQVSSTKVLQYCFPKFMSHLVALFCMQFCDFSCHGVAQVFVPSSLSQQTASVVRRERTAVMLELGGDLCMQSADYSELSRIMQARSLKEASVLHNNGTGHLDDNTCYRIAHKLKSSTPTTEAIVFVLLATPKEVLMGPQAIASGMKLQRYGDMTYLLNSSGVNAYAYGMLDVRKSFMPEIICLTNKKMESAELLKNIEQGLKHGQQLLLNKVNVLQHPHNSTFRAFGPVPTSVSCTLCSRIAKLRSDKEVMRRVNDDNDPMMDGFSSDCASGAIAYAGTSNVPFGSCASHFCVIPVDKYTPLFQERVIDTVTGGVVLKNQTPLFDNLRAVCRITSKPLAAVMKKLVFKKWEPVEPLVVDAFNAYKEGPMSNFTMADVGMGNSNQNMAEEGFWDTLKDRTGVIKDRLDPLHVYLPRLIEFIEIHSEQCKYQSQPAVGHQCWLDAQNYPKDYASLCNSVQVDGDGVRVIVPSDSFLKNIPADINRLDYICAERSRFIKLCVECKTPASADRFIARNNLTFDQVLDLMTSFRVLTQLAQPWGNASLGYPVRYICSCFRFWKYLHCKHSLREAIVSLGLPVPEEHSAGTFGIKARRGRRWAARCCS
jgi:hypothetical protein